MCFFFQSMFGTDVLDPSFRLYQSDAGNNLLFKDSTKCLKEIPSQTTADAFLGTGYVNAVMSLRQCPETASGMLRSFKETRASEQS